jgi:hypothetical protein
MGSENVEKLKSIICKAMATLIAKWKRKWKPSQSKI